MEPFEVFVIVVAGGSGLRMQAPVKKQYLPLKGKPVLHHTLQAFGRVEEGRRIVLAVPGEDLEYCRNTLPPLLDTRCELFVISGGEKRLQSVANALAEVKRHCRDSSGTIVLIHDGVRPFVEPGLIRRCLRGAVRKGACVPALSSVDTLKEVDEKGTVVRTVDRKRIFRIQTPQAFRLDLIMKAFDIAAEDGFEGTDDASVAEYAGYGVHVTEGSGRNIKITTGEDMALAEFLLSH
ncbi:MAG: 2-C-methyl-D-erythritol 4-phosphate cytidylyltransferase [Desulfobacteraceae bacterium]